MAGSNANCGILAYNYFSNWGTSCQQPCHSRRDASLLISTQHINMIQTLKMTTMPTMYLFQVYSLPFYDSICVILLMFCHKFTLLFVFINVDYLILIFIKWNIGWLIWYCDYQSLWFTLSVMINEGHFHVQLWVNAALTTS